MEKFHHNHITCSVSAGVDLHFPTLEEAGIVSAQYLDCYVPFLRVKVRRTQE